MKSLTKPIINRNIFEECIKKMRKNNEKKPMLMRKIGVLNQHMALYDQYAQNGQLSKFPRTYSNDENFKKNMEWLYKNRFRKNDEYSDLINKSIRCAYCFCGETSTLDHYLPQSVYPTLTITSINLVPSCSICNWNKGNLVPERGEEFWHPYYMDRDFLSDLGWLKANIKYDNNQIEFIFEIVGECSQDFNKLKYQFKLLKLYERYSKKANARFYETNIIEIYRKEQNFDIIKDELIISKGTSYCLWEKVMFQELYDDSQFENWLHNNYSE